MRRQAWWVSAVLVGVLAAGCGGGDEPTPAPTTDASAPTESPEPSTSSPVEPTAPTVPTPPPESEGDSAAAASAYARWWWGELVDYTIDSADVETFSDNMLPSCEVCTGLVGEVQSKVPDGGRSEGADITVTSAESSGAQPNGVTPVTVFFDQAAGRLLDSDGTVVEEYEATTQTRSDLYLVREGEKWLVRDASFGDPFS